MSDEMRFDMTGHPWGDYPWNYVGITRDPGEHGIVHTLCRCQVNHVECRRTKFKNKDGLTETIFVGKCQFCDKVYWYETNNIKRTTSHKS